ncbi:Ppx/GppA family phosphatase [Brevundimonas halotolerans]|uniref:Exopolyphosphatase/guanosine-5'-triphosphate, 3'-diphosphate pyrophosphatase n=1 Tax=Brevundimonas halotolerans TaxID=69670 RepID=A0A7W9A221_9CAUL|nr:Ppx/GppA family phosphatase [Brevundimonas halotolerans]MBB5659720.1 exopolyphosphatase/guanosine-5'-triphosphate,3'-diphosphate pyrophosphatase [Brevundimonas halotolerans]
MPEPLPATAMASADAAVIDIGSNSVRLVLYRLEGRAIWTVFNEKVLAGLGRDLPQTGRLSEEGVAMALPALRRFAAVIEGVRPQHVFIAATAAVREAEDGVTFCERVAAETGFHVRVLSGEDEARYAARGVLAGHPTAEGVAADMGGASLELIRLGKGEVGQGITLPLGPFSLADDSEFDAKKLRARIDKRLKGKTADFETPTLHAVGGAWRSIAQLHMAMSDYPLQIVHQYAMTADDAHEVARFVSRQSRTSLDRTPGVSRRRAETLPYAALVLEALIEKLALKTVEFSAWGLREGLLQEALSAEHLASDPLIAGCTTWGARQGISPLLPGAVQAWIDPVLPALPETFGRERDRTLTTAACHLCDLGARLHPDHRVELVFEQVLRAPVPGQTHAERAFLACALNARYGGPSATPQPDVINRLLDEEGRRHARALGQAIRLACDLSGRAPQLLAGARLAIDDGTLTLTPADGYADMLLGEQTRRRLKSLADTLDLVCGD